MEIQGVCGKKWKFATDTIATDLGVPHSTTRGWLGRAPKVLVSLDVTDLRAAELQQEVLELRRRGKKQLEPNRRRAQAHRRGSTGRLRACRSWPKAVQ